jgi:hypothetical protein
MKALALTLGVLLLLTGAAAFAQTPMTPSAPGGSSSAPAADTSQSPPNTNVDVKADVKTENKAPNQPASAGERRPDVNTNIEKKDQSSAPSDRRDDGGSALPRAASGGDRTTIFGLSPTAAVMIAAALLVVVILAIVAMTRSGESSTYIDRERRM